MRWFFQVSVSDCSNPRLCRLFLYILPSPSRFPNPLHIHHTGSSTHLDVPCLRPSISDCHTRSFIHQGVARLHPSIPIAHPYFFSLPVVVLLHVHLPPDPPPPFSFPRVFQGGPKFFMLPLGTTIPSSYSHLLYMLSPLHIPQIRDVAPTAAPRLPSVALCKFYLTGLLLPLVCVLPLASPMSNILIVLFSSP